MARTKGLYVKTCARCWKPIGEDRKGKKYCATCHALVRARYANGSNETGKIKAKKRKEKANKNKYALMYNFNGMTMQVFDSEESARDLVTELGIGHLTKIVKL